jgi:hypothetical protein
MLVGILVLVGLWLFFYKVEILKLPLSPYGQSSVWTVEAKINFDATPGRSSKVEFFIPPNQAHFHRLDESFVSRNYGVTVDVERDNRLSVWTIRHAPNVRQTLYYRAQFYFDEAFQGSMLSNRGTTERHRYVDAQRSAQQTIINNARQQSVDSLSFAANVIKSLNDTHDGNASSLLGRDYSIENIALTAGRLLTGPSAEEGPNIINRIVYGFELTQTQHSQQEVPLHIYLGIWDAEHGWRYINPENARVGLPSHFLIWQYADGKPILGIDGGRNSHFTYSFIKREFSALDVAKEEAVQNQSLLMKYSLFNLPLQTQEVYQILIMIPIGALIILLLRSFIGIHTFGTFMPVLIALAFRKTELVDGIILFVLIVSLGLGVRFYLEKLKLLLIPRLSAVLSTVVILMMTLSVFSNQLGFETGLSVALFPMVILTMTIERMSIVWEERNPWEAILQGIGSLFAASIAFVVMSNLYMEHLFFVFPELLLIVIAAMLLLGCYQGYRLSELIRFRELIKKNEY